MEVDNDKGDYGTRPLSETDLASLSETADKIKTEAASVNRMVLALLNKLSSGELDTANGISFLEMKNQMLLNYLLSLAGIINKKINGESIKDSTYLNQLIEMRVSLEKIRPIEHKLKYQIDKLTRGTQTDEDLDPLKHRANPDDLVGGDDSESSSSEEDEEKETVAKKPGIYVPPKIAPQYFDGDSTETSKAVEKAKKTVINKTLIRELQEEFLDTPVEVQNTGDSFTAKLTRDRKNKERYEETYMTRLPTTKQERHESRLKSISTMGMLGDEITNFSARSSVSKSVSSKSKKKKGFGKKRKGKGKK